MSVDLQNLKKIRPEINKLVFGYIHQYYKIDEDVPDDIIHICLLFYGYGKDEWDNHHVHDEMINGNTITGQGYAANSYLKRIAESGYHEWRFKVICRMGQVWIGIRRIDDDNPDAKPPMTDCFQSDGGGYAFTPLDANISHPVTGNYWIEYGQRCYDDQIIEMYLDLDALILGYRIDDVDYGKSHDVRKGRYRAAVYMCKHGCCITLVD